MSVFAIRDYRQLFSAQIIALFGTGLATVALGLLAYDLAGRNAGAVLGTALTIKMVMYVVIAPLAAAYVDRLPRRVFLAALDAVRAVAAGAFLDGGFAFVNRRPTFSPAGGESQTPVDPAAGRLAVRVLVDHASVELFLGDGRTVHSHRVFPLAGDDRIRLFSHGGRAVFEDLTIHRLAAPVRRTTE
jgi:MFS family permease